MAIDERFSYEEFASRLEQRASLDALRQSLHDEVLAELHEIVARKMEALIAALNRHGHALRPYVMQPGDILYRDQLDLDRELASRLRVGADIVVSVGFGATDPFDDASDGEDG